MSWWVEEMNPILRPWRHCETFLERFWQNNTLNSDDLFEWKTSFSRIDFITVIELHFEQGDFTEIPFRHWSVVCRRYRVNIGGAPTKK